MEGAMADQQSPVDLGKLYLGRIGAYLAALVASWPALALSGLCVVAFSAQIVTAPERLPPFGGLTLAQIGLPSAPDLGALNDPAREAAAAAERQARAAIEERRAAGELSFFENNPQYARAANLVGLLGSVVMLIFTMGLQTRRFATQRA
jgi:hypothetical protein